MKYPAKGLPPLPDPTPQFTEDSPQSKLKEGASEAKSKSTSKKPALTFSTANASAKPSAAKRKYDVVGRTSDSEEGGDDKRIKDKDSSKKSKTGKKQKKKPASKTLLSFGDDA